MADQESTAVEVSVRGRVQGVFFRDSCREQAELLGVAGWVSNEPDGTVAGRFEGPAAAVDRLVDWCRQGPRHASVVGVDVVRVEPEGARGFTVR